MSRAPTERRRPTEGARRAGAAAAAGLVVIAAVGIVLGRVVSSGPLSGPIARDLDAPVRHFATTHDTVSWHRLFSHVSTFGTAFVTGTVAFGAGALWSWHRRTWVILGQAVSVFAGAALLTVVVKFGVNRQPASGPIPAFAAGTFPSGHALFAISVYGLFAILGLRSRARAIARVTAAAFLVALVLAVGWSRVFLLDHYFSDLAGSLVLGSAWVAVVAFCGSRVARTR